MVGSPHEAAGVPGPLRASFRSGRREARMTPRGRLFRKYVLVIVGLVAGALVASGLVEIYFSYRENSAAIVVLQREKALRAASRIESFIQEIEHQMGWTTAPPLVEPEAALEQRRLDYLRLFRQVPAITELTYLDPTGKEQLRVSRVALESVASPARSEDRPVG